MIDWKQVRKDVDADKEFEARLKEERRAASRKAVDLAHTAWMERKKHESILESLATILGCSVQELIDAIRSVK